tara:strand:- start:242 stop:463 length:222 start_codon:yes stop_codon:yes gene_type:complete
MDILIVAAMTAGGTYIIIYKIIGRKLLAKTGVVWDIAITVGAPILFLGSFAGVASGILAGVIFSGMTALTPRD